MFSPVLITRPEAPGRALVDALVRADVDALWLPAFELGPAPDPANVDAVLARIEDFDLAVFVSPAAVHAAARCLPAPWPANTMIGVVGAATRAAIEQAIPGAARARLIGPAANESEGDATAGSEGLWDALAQAGVVPRRVLLLRAEQGREWLAERLRSAGAEVRALAVYTRRAAVLSDAMRDRLGGLVGQALRAQSPGPCVVVTSSEAVAALRDQLAVVPGAWEWLQRGRALATHPRIEAQLHTAGFADVEPCRVDAAAIVAKLRGQ